MKKAIVLLAVLALIFATAVPSEAWRGHRHGHWHGGWGWWLPGAVIGGLVLGAAVAATAPFYAPAPVYAAPPVVYQAPPPVIYQEAPAPAPPLVNREVVYPHGRHVLYGDGVTRAWQWVWIPTIP